MFILCLGMLLGLPHLEMAGWGGIYRPNPISSRWTENNNFLLTGVPNSQVHTGQGTVHYPVLASSADRWGL
jgi:hypothetical protein